MIISWLTCGCSNPSNNKGREEASNAPSNVIKVLNRVQCSDDSTICDKDTTNALWNLCMLNGYQENSQDVTVKAAREIKELVSKSMTVAVQQNVSHQQTDENGVVSNTDSIERVNEPREVIGYCIGSEYILE